MDRSKKTWLAINSVGGAAVLGSYVHGLVTHPETRNELWGSIPPELQGIYGVTMWLAAAGYVFFSYAFVVRTAHDVRFGPFGFGLINALYALIMVGAATWMPLTFAYLESPSPGLWAAIRLGLFTVGASSVGLTIALVTMQPRVHGATAVLALLGLLAFSLQTAFLDALVWPRFF